MHSEDEPATMHEEPKEELVTVAIVNIDSDGGCKFPVTMAAWKYNLIQRRLWLLGELVKVFGSSFGPEEYAVLIGTFLT